MDWIGFRFIRFNWIGLDSDGLDCNRFGLKWIGFRFGNEIGFKVSAERLSFSCFVLFFGLGTAAA